MWMPIGWWIITEVNNKGVRFTAGANGLPEIESSSKFRSDLEATSCAQKALRLMAYEVGLCELDTADGPYNKTGYRLERREDGFAVTVGLMEHITGWSVWEVLGWLNEKQAIPRRYDNARKHQ